MSHRHSLADWGRLLALVVMWGSAFVFTKVAVGGLSPQWVVTGRLWLAVLLLVPLAWLWAARPPSSLRLWLFLVSIALFGNLLPFLLVTWGLESIDSGVAGILMAVMPLTTLGLAHFLVPGERMTLGRLAGFLLGFCGVVVLMGPAALGELFGGGGPLLPMLAVLGGAICYGIAAILARLRPFSGHTLFSAAATITLAALMMLPFSGGPSAFVSLLSKPPEPAQLAAVAVLGVFSTALAAVVYFRLVASAGPAFVSQLNYLIPPWAVLIGILFLGERPEPRYFLALALILGGVLVTHLGPRAAASRTPGASRAPSRDSDPSA